MGKLRNFVISLVKKVMFSVLKNTVKHGVKRNVFSVDVFSAEKYGKTLRKVKHFQH